MSDSIGKEFTDGSDCWIEAAGWVGITLNISGGSEARWGVYYYLIHMSRLQFACEYSYHRIEEAEEITKSDDYTTWMAGIGRMYLDMHAFLVSSHSYWMTLAKLNTMLNVTSLSTAVTKNRLIAENTKRARDHLEHIVERVEIGRPARFGQVMDAPTFRGAMGQIIGGKVMFGDESFDLWSIIEAIRDAGKTVAPNLREVFVPKVSVTVTNPEPIP